MTIFYFIMKPQNTIRRSRLTFFYLLAFTFTIYTIASGQAQEPKESPGYVVIGAFTIEKNAIKLIDYARERNISAKYQIHPTKDLFYVYEQVDKPLAEKQRIKENFPEFYDVWVYRGELGRGSLNKVPTSTVVAKNEGDNKTLVITETDQSTHAGIAAADSEKEAETKGEHEASKNLERKENTYHVYLNTINAKNMKEVKGRVNVIDPVRAKQLLVAKSHEVTEVKNPNNGGNVIKLATDIFGFREVQQTINLDNPVNDTTQNFVHTIGDSIIVDFELQRFKKGDVLVMYNVYFFKDAAIMRPESIYELNSLLDMLKENESLVVKLHGHTNGNSHGKIIHLDPEDKNFFSLNADHKEDNGSAKKLSLFRAYTIQHWLIEQGIAEERIDIKGWGGKQMIYDKHDTQAYKNVRVEVEIVEE